MTTSKETKFAEVAIRDERNVVDMRAGSGPNMVISS